MLSQIAASEDLVFFRPHQFLTREHDRPEALYDILEGWACRHRLLPDGRRQITALYLPGDLCDPMWSLTPTCHAWLTEDMQILSSLWKRDELCGANLGKAPATL